MPTLQVQRIDETTDLRSFPNGHAEIVSIAEAMVGRVTYEPGWRWSRDLAPVMGTPSCQLHHQGYVISGVMHMAMDDGPSLDIGPGSAFDVPPGHDAWVVGGEPWVAVVWTSLRTYALTPDEPGNRVVATILLTDIVDSTATLARIGDAAWREQLLAHHVVLRELLNRFRGREIGTTGDGILAVFDSATRAVLAADAMRRSASAQGLEIRVGLHTGEVELIGGDARGLAVHAAARVAALGGAGEVVLSATTAGLLEGSGIQIEDAGRHALKGLAGERQVFRLGAAAPPLTGKSLLA